MTGATSQLTIAEQTVSCEAGHHRCQGTIFSLSAAHGVPCDCPCHAGD